MQSVKTFAALVCGTIGAVFGKSGGLAPILVVLLCANVADYITGVWAAAINHSLNSQKGANGPLKKLGYWLSIGVAFGVDVLFIYGGPLINLQLFTAPLICPAVSMWLALNELLSIIENLGMLGVPMPKFLKQTIALLRDSVEDSAAGGLNENDKK